MKLIDLLVQELPKRGGWPEGAVVAAQDNDGQLLFSSTDGIKWNGYSQWVDGCWIGELPWINSVADDCETSTITRDQYESALAASQKPAWNGEGLPLVGCECEFIGNDTSWGIVKIIGYDREGVVFRPNQDAGYYVFIPSEKHVFMPLRTEADKKRDSAINNMLTIIDCNGVDPKNSAIQIYDAIAAGKIPGVKLED